MTVWGRSGPMDNARGDLWAYRGLFAGLALTFVFLRLLPLSNGQASWPGPDLLVCLAFVWVIRRPDYVPVLLVAAVTLFTDFLLQRPPGLWTACVILGLEFLRSRSGQTRTLPPLAELGFVAVVLTAVIFGHRLILQLFAVPVAPVAQDVMLLLFSILAYPFVALVSHALLGVRKPIPGEVNVRGQRL